MPESASDAIVLYDGVCGLCNRLVQFLLKRDHNDRLRFASLQSNFAKSLLKRYGIGAHDLDTIHVVLDHGQATERVLSRSDAILHVLGKLGGVWKLSVVGRLIPKFIRDAIYNVVAGNRYKVFGKSESCMLPEPRHRAKFLEV